MRAALVVLVLVGCSYDWDSVQPYYLRDASTDGRVTADPRHTILPGTSCNPISNDGCDTGYCLGVVEADHSLAMLTCYSHTGSSARGGSCDGHPDFCTPELLCWTHPDDTTTSTCEESCFADEDCSSGTCDMGGSYQIAFSRSTFYRCL